MSKTIGIYSMIILAFIFGCKKNTSAPATGNSGSTVLQLLQNNYSISLFNAAVKYAGLADSLNGPGPYTIFVPDDQAFNADSIYTPADFKRFDTLQLRHLLKYHILNDQLVLFRDIAQKTGNPYTNWENMTLYISRPYYIPQYGGYGDFVTVNGNVVKKTDILASNGVIHILSRILPYPASSCGDYLAADTNFSFFVTALKKFNLYNQLQAAGTYTVFAPLNSAFLLNGITGDSLNTLDSIHFQKTLFSPYVLPGIRLFTSDVFDFQTGYGGLTAFQYVAPDKSFSVMLKIPYQSTPSQNSLVAWAQGYDPVTADPYPFYPGTNQQNFRDTIVSTNHITGNGVVQVTNNLMILPNYVPKY